MTTETMAETDLLPITFQYTVEAYKVFQKLAEVLANPMAAAMFAGFATDERHTRDLLEMKYASSPGRMQVTLGSDLQFLDMVEGDLSSREIVEILIAREKTIEKKLIDAVHSGDQTHRNLFHYIAAGKRAHLAHLQRELEMLQRYPDWFRREDAESLIVHGESAND